MEHRQKIMEIIGATGCYFLSIVYLAEKIIGKRLDAAELYAKHTANGNMGHDCFVNRPDRMLSELAGQNYTVRKMPAGYKPKKDELAIIRYERNTPAGLLAHFVVAAPDMTVEYDPLGNSQTVAFGRPVSLRVFR